MTSPDLKSCPFCGGLARLASGGPHEPNDWCGLCDACDFSLGFQATRDAAITAWNTRAPIAAAQPLEAGSGWRPDREALAEAIKDADDSFGYSMNLISLVDGETTYRLQIGDEVTEHPDTDECYEKIAIARNKVRADAILALSPPPSDHLVSEPLEGAGDVVLKADFLRSLPGGKLDDSAYEAIEEALDRADAPMRVDGKWLTLAERVAALAAIQSPPLGGSVQEDYGRRVLLERVENDAPAQHSDGEG